MLLVFDFAESDTDNSDTANGPCVKKRKPGRPRKCDPNKTTGVTGKWSLKSHYLDMTGWGSNHYIFVAFPSFFLLFHDVVISATFASNAAMMTR